MASVIAAVAALEAGTFLIGAVSHLAVRIPLGFATLAEPRIMPAAIVEGLCAAVLAASAGAVAIRHARAWMAVVVAQAISLAGVLLGIAALAAGQGPHSEVNDIYHRVMVVALLAGLALLATPTAKKALHRRHATAEGEGQ